MKFNIFWMWNPSFLYRLMVVWYTRHLRLMKSDFQKSQIIWYLLFSYTRLRCLQSVMNPQNFTEALTSQLSKKKWANSSAYLHFNHTLCRFSISLYLPLPLCFSRSFSQSQRGLSLYVWFPLSLLSGMMFKRWLSARFPSTCLYSIDAQMKFNGQNMTHTVTVLLFGAFSHLRWKNYRLMWSIWKESEG